MAIEMSAPRSRRALLAAAAGAAAATVVSAIEHPAPVSAGIDGDVVLGALNEASSTTRIVSTGTDAALDVQTTSSTGWAIHATSTNYPTVVAESSGNAGLYGVGHGSNGAVLGQSVGTGPGVLGSAGLNHTTPPSFSGMFGYGAQGVVGQSDGSAGYVGVQGFTGAGDPPVPAPVGLTMPAGVYGEAVGADPTGVWGEGGTATSGSTTGVYGEGDTGVWGFGGWGVFGASDATGTGVYGFSGESVPAAPAHTGVFGYSDSGTGVYAKAATGTALSVNGKATFSRSGKVAVGAGRSYVDVDLRTKGGLAGSPLCFANLTVYRSGVYVAAIRPNYPTTGKLRIYLNKALTSSTYVAYFVVN